MLLQQNPIVVEVTKQPPVTPEISYGSILGSAALMAVVILLAAAVVGGLVGAVIIWRKKRLEATIDTSAPSHVRLKISS
jgi:hypothetical protein